VVRDTAVQTDLVEPRSWLTTNSVDQFQTEPKKDNGTQSSAQNQLEVEASNF
jgi:hypothetical protein